MLRHQETLHATLLFALLLPLPLHISSQLFVLSVVFFPNKHPPSKNLYYQSLKIMSSTTSGSRNQSQHHQPTRPKAPSSKASSVDTGYFQETPRLKNQFKDDVAIQRILSRTLPPLFSSHARRSFNQLTNLSTSISLTRAPKASPQRT